MQVFLVCGRKGKRHHYRQTITSVIRQHNPNNIKIDMGEALGFPIFHMMGDTHPLTPKGQFSMNKDFATLNGWLDF